MYNRLIVFSAADHLHGGLLTSTINENDILIAKYKQTHSQRLEGLHMQKIGEILQTLVHNGTDSEVNTPKCAYNYLTIPFNPLS